MSSKVFGLLVGAVTLVVANVTPASAEFFGCNDAKTKVSYSSNYRSHFAQTPAQRPRFTSQPAQRRMASSQPRFPWQ